jgi:hypothetical protein
MGGALVVVLGGSFPVGGGSSSHPAAVRARRSGKKRLKNIRLFICTSKTIE